MFRRAGFWIVAPARDAGADDASMGETCRVSAREMIAQANCRNSPGRGEANMPDIRRSRLSGRQRNLQHNGALARRAAGDGICRGADSDWARVDPDVLFSYATFSADRVSAAAECRLLVASTFTFIMSATSKVPVAAAKSHRRHALILGEFGMDTIRHSRG